MILMVTICGTIILNGKRKEFDSYDNLRFEIEF